MAPGTAGLEPGFEALSPSELVSIREMGVRAGGTGTGQLPVKVV